MNLLEKVDSIEDLKSLKTEEKAELAKEIREFIIDIVSKNGGHLASNLGVVELTIALHSVFNVPEDKIVWDVGHQTYVHKILTGRKSKMKDLRKKNGIAGFPKTCEAEEDCFNTGHSSTSISAALGMARARDLQKKTHYVIGVIGDGALTGGMALEALNDAGGSNTNLIVILNDNAMSISKNVGGISSFLNRLRTRRAYQKSNESIKRVVEKIPYLGEKIIHGVRKIKRGIKQLYISNMIFEDMGFTYFGPIDGHNIEKIENALKNSKKINGPVLIHVITEKGKGYSYAEQKPEQYHSIAEFRKEDGKTLKEKQKDYSAVFGKKLCQIALKNEKVVAITAAMKDGTGLSEFAKIFPERFFDVAIAEQHAVTMAAGMAKAGMVPVVPIYTSFFQRAYDQVIHDVCMQNLPVILCGDRAGIVGKDGETHQGLLDFASFRIVPNLTIMAPKNFSELEKMLEQAIELKRPVYIRYPRGGENYLFEKEEQKLEVGKAERLRQGNDITILAIGKMVGKAMQVAKKMEESGIDAEVWNVRYLKPFDDENIGKAIQKTRKVIVLEDGIKIGGLGSYISEMVARQGIGIKLETYGYPDKFIEHGTVEELEDEYDLNVDHIVAKWKEKIGENNES